VKEVDFDMRPIIKQLYQVVKTPERRAKLVENATASFVNLAMSGMLLVI
jgi:hypothetical protein